MSSEFAESKLGGLAHLPAKPLQPKYALVAGVDLVVIRLPEDEGVSVLYGRCLHRGALLADGHVEGKNLICGVHNWDYCYRTGVSSYNPAERLTRFGAWLEEDQVFVDADEIAAWERENPQPYDRAAYQGLVEDGPGKPLGLFQVVRHALRVCRRCRSAVLAGAVADRRYI